MPPYKKYCKLHEVGYQEQCPVCASMLDDPAYVDAPEQDEDFGRNPNKEIE